eukprot:scaffold698_cov333-Pavlova_lutheri.AAC.1
MLPNSTKKWTKPSCRPAPLVPDGLHGPSLSFPHGKTDGPPVPDRLDRPPSEPPRERHRVRPRPGQTGRGREREGLREREGQGQSGTDWEREGEGEREGQGQSDTDWEREGEGEGEGQSDTDWERGRGRRRGTEGERDVWWVRRGVVAHRRRTCSCKRRARAPWSGRGRQHNHATDMGDVQEGNAGDGREMEVDLAQHPSGIQPQLQYVQRETTRTRTRRWRGKRNGRNTKQGKAREKKRGRKAEPRKEKGTRDGLAKKKRTPGKRNPKPTSTALRTVPKQSKKKRKKT